MYFQFFVLYVFHIDGYAKGAGSVFSCFVLIFGLVWFLKDTAFKEHELDELRSCENSFFGRRSQDTLVDRDILFDWI